MKPASVTSCSIRRVKAELACANLNREDFELPALRYGISLVVASFNGSTRVRRLFESIANQSLDHELLEILLVINGSSPGMREAVENLRSDHPQLNLRVVWTTTPNLPRARNIGMSLATRQFITFADDDDYLEEHFLAGLIGKSSDTAVVVGEMIDADQGFSELRESSISNRFRSMNGQKYDLRDVAWILGFNSAKLVPTRFAKLFKYCEFLESGEDVVFFANFLALEELAAVPAQGGPKYRYVRQLREQSKSRQAATYDFAVTQRVRCISELQKIDVPEFNRKGILQLISAQGDFIKRYLNDNPTYKRKIESLLLESGIRDLDWPGWFNEEVHTIVYSFCFLPYADTSAIVMAKILLEKKKFVDVISANMSSVRSVDRSFYKELFPLVRNHVELKTGISFAAWAPQVEFAEKALAAAKQLQSQRKARYSEIYSRALWAASHLAATLHKLEDPEVYWVAEFSDPLKTDASGRSRHSDFPSGKVAVSLAEKLSALGVEDSFETSFELIELVTLVFADQLIFTNLLQRDFMLSGYTDKVRAMALEKAEVRPHPSPPPRLYQVEKVELPQDGTAVTVGYFGNFYPNRGLGEILDALNYLPASVRKKVMFHVFTDSLTIADEQKSSDVRESLEVHRSVSFLEFLSLSKCFDYLLVGDAETKGLMPVNPFLPSKYSDYIGAGVPIWIHAERGSTLDGLGCDVKSRIGDPDSIATVISKIVEEQDV